MIKRLLSSVMVCSVLFSMIPVAVAAVKSAPVVSPVALTPNEMGRIPFLEYHQVGPKEDRWTRSFEQFRKDLEWLYNNDYRAISTQDFLNQTIRVPFGKKPVVFTFDDGGYTQLLMKDGKVDPYTAVGIMDQFLVEYPDFGSAAIFYVNQNPFKLTEKTGEALKYLLKTGRELGNHTIDHSNLSLIAPAAVAGKVQQLEDYLKKFDLGSHTLDSIAYPFGGVPKGAGYEVMKKKFRLGLLVGAEPSWSPYHAKFDAMRVPRIQAIDDEWSRWFKRKKGETGKKLGSEIFAPYVSDGNPDVVAVAAVADEKILVKDRLRAGVVAKVWDGVMLEKVEQVAASVEKVEEKIEEKVQKIEKKMEVVPMKKPREVYPYDACKDPDADTYISYKRDGAMLPEHLQFSWKYFTEGPKFLKSMVDSASGVSFFRGIYITASTALGNNGKVLVEKLIASGGNMVVFDLDESDGALKYKAGGENSVLRDMKPFIEYLKSKNIFVVARVVAFKEKKIARVRPDMAIQNAGGGVWRDRAGYVWLDPSNPDVVQYAIDMAKEAAAMGVDEVQFDYVRFPTEGNIGAARFKYDPAKKQKWEVIRDFLKEARRQTFPMGVKLSADVFGIVGWQPAPNYKTLGQRIECIAPYLDTIYPMGYPSHFGPGFGGHNNPADEPYYFNKETNDNFVKYARGTETTIRPWLQGFTYRVTIPYNSDYMYQQIRAARDAQGDGFVFWNASNVYTVVMPAIGR